VQILKGTKPSKEILHKLAQEVEILKKNGINTCLCAVGEESEAFTSYLKGVKRKAEKYGIKLIMKLQKNADEEFFIRSLNSVSADKRIHGILLNQPLPLHVNRVKILEALAPEKDVDCITSLNQGRLFSGMPLFQPATPLAVMKLFQYYNINVRGKNVVILGRSKVVSLPLALMLLKKGVDATVTVCHSKTQDLERITKKADIIVCAVNRARFLKADMVSEGAVVIDVGIHMENGNVVGDVDFEGMKEKVSAISPVPKGVGTLTSTFILYNTLKAAGGEEFEGIY